MMEIYTGDHLIQNESKRWMNAITEISNEV